MSAEFSTIIKKIEYTCTTTFYQIVNVKQ